MLKPLAWSAAFSAIRRGSFFFSFFFFAISGDSPARQNSAVLVSAELAGSCMGMQSLLVCCILMHINFVILIDLNMADVVHLCTSRHRGAALSGAATNFLLPLKRSVCGCGTPPPTLAPSIQGMQGRTFPSLPLSVGSTSQAGKAVYDVSLLHPLSAGRSAVAFT